jgi:D-3-phosphoglycerate dehydrogenase
MNIKITEKTLKECRILVTPTTFGKCEPSPLAELEDEVGEIIFNPTDRPLKAYELRELVRDIDGIIAGLDEIDASVIDAANRLKVIARYGVGIDRVDIAEATSHGIIVTNSPGANSVSVAELTVCLMLALARRLCNACKLTRMGEWPRIDGVGLQGKTIGLVGFGSIGREVASRLKAFHCRLFAADPYIKPEIAGSYNVELLPLGRLLSQSDFVSLHLALLPSVVGMVNREFLNKMKKGAFLINTARGELIDEPALVESLEKGYLRGAALDCFAKEPPGRENPLLSFEQVIVTPHTGSHTDNAVSQMSRISMNNCLAALRGERPMNIVNPEVYEHFFEDIHVEKK